MARVHYHRLDLSRRRLLQGAAFALGGGALVAAGQASAANKLSKKVAHYQEQPKGAQRCDNCIQWAAPNACKIVEGAISPSGWCMLYAPAPRA